MISLETKTFSNCLLNASGAKFMTLKELLNMKNS